MHDAQAYAEWNPVNGTSAGVTAAGSVTELRAESRTHRILTPDEAAAAARAGQVLNLAPLCGGLPPDIAWKYLRTAADAGECQQGGS